ncbi:MAG: peptide deformylase [Maritimibacter sp.]
MAELPVLLWPDARLSMRCDPIDTISDDIQTLAADMFDTMYAAPGRGLAGPQVGAMIRIFVMDAGWKDGTPSPVVMINPEILTASDEQVEMVEGCLSIPGIETPITRPTRVRMRWTDLQGVVLEADLDGAEARIAQHELDHLDGLVTFDRLPPEFRAGFEKDYAG